MKNILKKLVLLIILVSIISCRSTETPVVPIKSATEKAVDDFTHMPQTENASLGMKVVNLESGKTLFKLNPDKSLVPASNMKLLTTGAALEILGKDYRFKTILAYDGKIGSDGTLDGNIYIIGGGDPTLGSKYLAAEDPERVTTGEKKKQLEFLNIWAEKIKSMGIKKINGQIVADPSYYPETTLSQTWEWGDLRYTFASRPSGLTFLDNSIRLILQREDGNIRASVSPSWVNTVVTNRVAADEIRPSKITLVVSPYTNEIVALGTMNKPIISYNTVMQDPASALAVIFSKTLKEEGIKNNGGRLMGKNDKAINKNNLIYTQYSPKLEEIIGYTNKYSVNLFSEHLKIEAEKKLRGKSKESVETMKGYWSNRLSARGLYIYDGSGLSRYNGVTPDTLVELLKYMKKSENFSSFYDSLAEPGKNGTFKKFQEQTVLVDNLHGKSGTLTGVKSYGGYMYNVDGDLLAFSIIINHHGMSGTKISEKLEKVMESIYYLK
ncbi:MULTISPECIES: D-alanyl-D-alanine carboxypeptidase/D-alanyl-D-alanine endopeptidase [Psychrilyobacter]|uniref:D-alanyl-D-alanine carboxypeptidase/D-alanyl-D-alanine-endopeptidase n=1 Tax=Psychrilyobacter piezotolerans TaxID=2293438 RepID=A0ABX9KG55_9FUSO|nr:MULTISPECIES: D-alanyl-D-alanine carboxypeptidase/D-alanyl-D-alanine-endopeptidase [Psychrilyobacter]MCS5422093.1 D-alanyl-D-alanine carboxypeptidase/D-alanyl-D-alanine-endopeptidase [Psychrilyobacter sp. S5]NDI78381.1 D-alanyl-D-alanine carboxypeptidase/D-alanyl-D-alanine-endopeptidase [Psychrilyobacter piezotolerans]RDE61107.1 D-alanyl-D-alanine carboxypeptidase/D-alanyl-D-alanine-endopeptidase [Psychrilyobacter sp. S5]REI40748.1 D-alanyl-D-alanine carboxypeptidase/D-alanyl-D-alanine-endop